MSQENVELVRRDVGALTALGESGLELEGRRSAAIDLPEAASVFEEYWHPQAVFDVSLRLDGGVYYGPEGVRRGQFVHYAEYTSRADALEAAGLRP